MEVRTHHPRAGRGALIFLGLLGRLSRVLAVRKKSYRGTFLTVELQSSILQNIVMKLTCSMVVCCLPAFLPPSVKRRPRRCILQRASQACANVVPALAKLLCNGFLFDVTGKVSHSNVALSHVLVGSQIHVKIANMLIPVVQPDSLISCCESHGVYTKLGVQFPANFMALSYQE